MDSKVEPLSKRYPLFKTPQYKKCTAPKEKGEEEKAEEDGEKEREEENEGEGEKDEVAVNVVEEILSDEKEQHKQVHRKRVKSWRALQTAKSLAEGMRPRKELLKKRHKLNKYTQEEKQQQGNEDEEEDEETEEENFGENEQITELVAQRKLPGSYSTRKAVLTNRNDYKHRHLLDEADFLSEQASSEWCQLSDSNQASFDRL